MSDAKRLHVNLSMSETQLASSCTVCIRILTIFRKKTLDIPAEIEIGNVPLELSQRVGFALNFSLCVPKKKDEHVLTVEYKLSYVHSIYLLYVVRSFL